MNVIYLRDKYYQLLYQLCLNIQRYIGIKIANLVVQNLMSNREVECCFSMRRRYVIWSTMVKKCSYAILWYMWTSTYAVIQYRAHIYELFTLLFIETYSYIYTLIYNAIAAYWKQCMLYIENSSAIYRCILMYIFNFYPNKI